MATDQSDGTETQARVVPTILAKLSESALVDETLREEERVREVLARHLRAPAAEISVGTSRASARFKRFMPSKFTPSQRKVHYLAPKGNLTRETSKVVGEWADKAQESTGRSAFRVRLGDDFKALLKKSSDKGTVGVIDRQTFLDHLKQKLSTPTLFTEPAATACRAKLEAKRILGESEDVPEAPGAPPPAGASSGPVQQLNPLKFAREHVPALMDTMVPPEAGLEYRVDRRARLDDTETAVSTFQLRAGASDVVSYHDFRALQIAFPHIWTEIFDGELALLGRRLYREAEQLETFLSPGGKSKLNFDITSIPDLQRLLSVVAELSDVVQPDGQPSGKGFNFFRELDKIFNPPRTDESESPPDGRQDVAEALRTIPGAVRLSLLMTEITQRLSEEYAFKVFAEDSVNFGIMVTYRQSWTPEQYQVGELVSTIPLAPRETRRYTTRRVVKKSRAAKELEESLRTTRSDSVGTSRVEREIVDKAQSKTDFDVQTHGSFGAEGSFKTDVTANAGGEQAAQSERTKRHFHEAVLKSAQEYRQQRRLEVDTLAGEETEDTTFHEIQNPNDELTVTYLLYELERTYRISERIHQLTPVVLVANPVPAPNAIDDAWLTAHDWILRRVILDDSFRPALEYLTKSYVGAELNIRVLETNAKAHKQVVNDLKVQLQAQIATLEAAQRDLANKVGAQGGLDIAEGFLGTVKKVFDPLGLTGKEAIGTSEGMQTFVDFAQESVDRAEREKARLLDQLGAASTALQVAMDKLSAAIKEHYDRVQEIDRLRLHVKQNILYYMQAIWSYEPRDQRFFRVYDVDVPIVEPEGAWQVAVANEASDAIGSVLDAIKGVQNGLVSVDAPKFTLGSRKLVEVADLDTVLGYKGNYAIYPLLENNYVTLHMMQDYLDVSDVVKLRDPDDFASYTARELQELAECLREESPATFDKYREDLRELIIKRLMSGRPEDDRVIVPTDGLYIEALVGTHPLLEDFKLIHRALDVKKVQAEVRRAELENVRLGARALGGTLEDPDIEKTILVQGVTSGMAIEPPTD